MTVKPPSPSRPAAPREERPRTADAPATTPDDGARPDLAPQGQADNPVWASGGRPPKVVRVAPPAPDYITQVKCNDLLQKSALGEPVSAADRDFLRKECR